MQIKVTCYETPNQSPGPTWLNTILNPKDTDAKAKADQWAKIEAFGGEEAVINRGLSNSPVPGVKPVFHYFK